MFNVICLTAKETITQSHSHSISNTISDGLNLSDFADISQVIIAAVNIGLAGYIFFYQIRQAKKAEIKSDQSNITAIKLQWFKELIIQPRIKYLDSFIANLQGIKTLIDSENLSEDRIIHINEYIKTNLYNYRSNFYDSIRSINNDMYIKLRTEAEQLVDKLTTTFSDNNFNFKDSEIYEKEVLEKIAYHHDNTLAIIITYKGE